MTFGELAQMIVVEMRPDGDTSLDLPKAGPYHSSAFGRRLHMLLAAFTRDSHALWTPKVEITVEEGDHEFSFADSANCVLSMHDVREVWLSGQRLARRKNAQELAKGLTPSTPAGLPFSFAQLTSTSILFDRPVHADLADCWAQGYYRHPVPEDDDSLVELPEEDLLLFEAYAGANLRRNVAQDEVGLLRLREVNRAAAEAVMRLRAERMRRMYSGSGW